jgi:hypothetical protein
VIRATITELEAAVWCFVPPAVVATLIESGVWHPVGHDGEWRLLDASEVARTANHFALHRVETGETRMGRA